MLSCSGVQPSEIAAMAIPDTEALLGLVKDLDKVLDRYLSGCDEPCVAVPQILKTCEQMRAQEPGAAVKYWLGAIEHHAREIANPRKREGADADFLTSSGFLNIQILKDIYYLRTQLMNARATVH
jgi:hypothetical protein